MKKIIILLVLLLQFTVNADAASLRLDGANGVYTLTGYDFVDIGGVEVEVQYDATTLANPRITAGSSLASAMFMPNPNFSASSIKIAAMSLSSIKAGELAVITFDLKGATAGPVLLGRTKLAAVTGTKVAQGPVDTGTGAGGPTGGGPTTGGGTTGGGTTGGGTTGGGTTGGGYTGSSASTVTNDGTSPSMGTITLPQDQMAPTDRKTEYQPLVTDLRKDMNVPLGGADAAPGVGTSGSAGAAKDKDAEKKFESFNGVLQLFKAFTGERTMKSLISLFADAEITGFTQNPPVAIADGKTPVIVTVVLKVAAEESPNFIMQGATVQQLSRDDEKSTWTIVAVPKKDVFDARVTIVNGAKMYDYPLTVTPKIDPLLNPGKKLSEADFSLYLSKTGKFDFNADKNFDAIDDFIYTANYILAMKVKPEKSAKPEAKEKSDKPESKEKGGKPEAKDKVGKPEAKEKIPADKKAVPVGTEQKTKDSSVKDEEVAPVKAPAKK